MLDGQGDCNDFSDECPTRNDLRQENVFSSRDQLIANPILRAFVWIMGLLATVGNLVSIKFLTLGVVLRETLPHFQPTSFCTSIVKKQIRVAQYL